MLVYLYPNINLVGIFISQHQLKIPKGAAGLEPATSRRVLKLNRVGRSHRLSYVPLFIHRADFYRLCPIASVASAYEV